MAKIKTKNSIIEIASKSLGPTDLSGRDLEGADFSGVRFSVALLYILIPSIFFAFPLFVTGNFYTAEHNKYTNLITMLASYSVLSLIVMWNRSMAYAFLVGSVVISCLIASWQQLLQHLDTMNLSLTDYVVVFTWCVCAITCAICYGIIFFRALTMGVNLQGALLNNANLKDSKLQRAQLQGASLISTNLINANLYAANLINADLSDANLENAKLFSCRLDHAVLHRTRLIFADLRGSILQSANR